MKNITFLFVFYAGLTSASSHLEVCKLYKKHVPIGISTIEYFEVDIDGNKTPDIFISEGSRGNAGGLYKILLNSGQEYSYLGEVFIHPLAFQFIKSQNSSYPMISTYIRKDLESGKLVSYEFDGKEYKEIKSVPVLYTSFSKDRILEKVNVINTNCK